MAGSVGKRFRIGLVTAAGVMLLVWLAASYLLGPRVATRVLAATSLVRTIVASGRVVTPLRVGVSSQISGAVRAVPVREGQSVVAGQALIEIDGSEAGASVEQARAALMQSEARLRQVRELALPAAQQAVRQAEVNLQNSQRQHERLVALQRQGFIGQAQLDDARRALDVAESQLRSARLQVSNNDERGSELLAARAAVAQAQASLAMAQTRQTYTTLRAPVAGILIARSIERGDVVQPGKVLMVLSPAGSTQLVVQIDEKNLARLKPGQKALASADAYPDQRFGAELVYINPAIDPQRGSVQVKLDVAQAPAYLRQDMTISVELEVERLDAAIVVPATALQYSSDGAAWVMKHVAGRAVRQAVKTGQRQTGKVEIVSGVVAGDEVILDAGVADGRRVRATPVP
jgi:HlyD family secretion protein